MKTFLYYCNDRALKSCCLEKPPSLDELLFCQTLPCNHTPKELKFCNHYCLLGLLMYFQGAMVCHSSSFTKGAMVINKQAHQVLQYRTCKYPQNGYFSTSAETF